MVTKRWEATGQPAWGIEIHLGTGRPPVYQQIVDQVRYHVAAGTLKTGEKLPTVRDLARALDINVNTAAKAYHDLASQGLILGRQRGGSAVAEGVRPDEAERKKRLEELYGRMLAEAASYGIKAPELGDYVQRRTRS